MKQKERALEPALKADVGQQQEVDHRGPNLGEHGVLGGPQEGLDLQMLLDPLEEKLHLPASFIKLGDGPGGKEEVVGQEIVSSLGSKIMETDETQRSVIFFFGIEA